LSQHYDWAAGGRIDSQSTRAHLDCHLMIERPEQYAKAFIEAGQLGFGAL